MTLMKTRIVVCTHCILQPWELNVNLLVAMAAVMQLDLTAIMHLDLWIDIEWLKE